MDDETIFQEPEKRHPVAAGRFCRVLVILYGSMIFAGFLSPYPPTTRIPEPGLLSAEPHLVFRRPRLQSAGTEVRCSSIQLNWRYAPVQGRVHTGEVLRQGARYSFLGLFRYRLHLFGTTRPYEEGRECRLEDRRRDISGLSFRRRSPGTGLVHAASSTARGFQLTIGFVGTAISLTLAIILGGLAGFYGGAIDWLIMRSAEFVILIPGLYLILFLRSVLSCNMNSGQSFILITVILSFVGWPGSRAADPRHGALRSNAKTSSRRRGCRVSRRS